MAFIVEEVKEALQKTFPGEWKSVGGCNQFINNAVTHYTRFNGPNGLTLVVNSESCSEIHLSSPYMDVDEDVLDKLEKCLKTWFVRMTSRRSNRDGGSNYPGFKRISTIKSIYSQNIITNFERILGGREVKVNE